MRNDLPDIPMEAALPQDGDLDEPATLPLSVGWIAYAGAIGVFAISWHLALYSLVVYLACGFVLTRFVLRALVLMHPLHDTIANEFQMKISMLLFWPVSMLILLIQLTVNRLL